MGRETSKGGAGKLQMKHLFLILRYESIFTRGFDVWFWCVGPHLCARARTNEQPGRNC